MDKSDIDYEYDHGLSPAHSGKGAVFDKTDDSTLHSGHFMKSRIHIPSDEDDTTDDNSQHSEYKNPGYNFTDAPQHPVQYYDFGGKHPIDESLTKLFQCMTLAYRYVCHICDNNNYNMMSSSHSFPWHVVS